MKRILTSKEYRFIKGLKELMTKYNAVISTDAQGKIEIVVNEDDESFDFETESTIYLGECFSKYGGTFRFFFGEDIIRCLSSF